MKLKLINGASRSRDITVYFSSLLLGRSGGKERVGVGFVSALLALVIILIWGVVEGCTSLGNMIAWVYGLV
jgi:hypothetical protein